MQLCLVRASQCKFVVQTGAVTVNAAITGIFFKISQSREQEFVSIMYCNGLERAVLTLAARLGTLIPWLT
jgi:hypothetical protein